MKGFFSIHKMSLSIGQQQLLSLMLFACGFFAVQRFTINPINAVICTIPLILFALQLLNGHYQTALTYLLIALFLSIDNGGGAYAETVTPLRYFIYISAISMPFLLSKWRIQRKPLLLAVLLGCVIAFGSVASALGTIPIDVVILKRDLIVLFILSTFLLDRGLIKLELDLVFSASLGYLVGEVVNAFFFYKDFTEYLSYDSLKSFVVFPVVYTLLRRWNVFIQVVLALMTISVISLYGTRMLTLSFIVLITMALVVLLIKFGRGKSLLAFLIAFIILLNINLIEFFDDTYLIQFKALSVIVKIQENFEASDISRAFALLDPVRFVEHQLFFERPILEIIFGSGLGSGIYDADGALAFVTFDQTAFSEQEITSSTFYNFHDFWIDFGLRFGLLPVIYLILSSTLIEMWRGSIIKGILLGFLLINTTFAISGILLTALLFRFWPFDLSGTMHIRK